MTDDYRSLTIDLGPLGLSSYRESLDGLTRRYLVPRAEGESELTESALSELTENVNALAQSNDQWYKRKVPLYDYLLSLKAEKTQRIGQKVRARDFWKCLPENFKFAEDDCYSKLYDLKVELSDQLNLYVQEDVRKEIRRLNEKLNLLQYDVRLILDGHYDSQLSSFIDESWVPEKSFSTYFKKEDRPSAPSIGRWGDLSSSDEDDFLAAAVKSLTRAKESSNPGITLPGDFDICFPMLGKRIEKLCNHYQWEKRFDTTVLLRSQGLIPFQELEDGTIQCSLENNERLALLSLYACVGAMFLKPQSLALEDNTEVALTYVCSAIAREKLVEGDDKELMKIALKNGDGGKSVFSGRLLFLTKAGDSAINMIIGSLDKLVNKFARELKEDQLDDETCKAITDRAFTTIEGMLSNCYRKTKAPVYENRTVPGKKGKTPVKVGEKLVVSPPDLSSSRLPLKAKELTKVNTLRQDFNDRRSEVEKRISKVASPTIFTAPLMCKEVVAEAYQKLQPYRVILRSRTTKIRDVATKANNGAKPGPGDWAAAMTKVLNDTEEISEEVWNFLSWEESE